jgi:hypothetical protein
MGVSGAGLSTGGAFFGGAATDRSLPCTSSFCTFCGKICCVQAALWPSGAAPLGRGGSERSVWVLNRLGSFVPDVSCRSRFRVWASPRCRVFMKWATGRVCRSREGRLRQKVELFCTGSQSSDQYQPNTNGGRGSRDPTKSHIFATMYNAPF